MPIKAQSKRYITLIELLIVVALLGMAAAAASWSISNAIRQQRYFTSVETLVQRLNLAQDIILLMEADVKVEIKESKGEFFLQMEVEGNLPKPLRRLAEKKESLSGIKKIRLDGDEVRNATMQFFSQGPEMPAFSLQLIGASVRYVHFSGYPHPIRISKDEKSPYGKYRMEQESQEMYPSEARPG